MFSIHSHFIQNATCQKPPQQTLLTPTPKRYTLPPKPQLHTKTNTKFLSNQPHDIQAQLRSSTPKTPLNSHINTGSPSKPKPPSLQNHTCKIAIVAKSQYLHLLKNHTPQHNQSHQKSPRHFTIAQYPIDLPKLYSQKRLSFFPKKPSSL